MSKSIFILKVKALEDDFVLDEKKPPFVNPMSLFEANMFHSFAKYFSTKEKAVEHFESVFKDLEPESQKGIIYYEIEEKVLDMEVDTGNYEAVVLPERRVMYGLDFDMDSEFLGNDNPKYNVGDWIMYTENGQVMVGRIVHQPPKSNELKKGCKYDQYDNCYYVIYESPENPNDTYPHSHLWEGRILRTIPEEEITKYLPKEHVFSLTKKLEEYK